MSPDIIQQLWGNPEDLSAKELKAFKEWLAVWEAPDDQYEEYLDKWLRNMQPRSEPLHIQGYTDFCTPPYPCDARGTGNEIGTHVVAKVTDNESDGCISQSLGFQSGSSIIGGYYIVVADNGATLPEAEDLPPAEPMLVSQGDGIEVYAQTLGYNRVSTFFRFWNVSIPQGSKIQKAVLRFYSATGNNGNGFEVFISGSFNIYPPANWFDNTDKPRTDNRRLWEISQQDHNDWLTYAYTNTQLDSADLACVIQEMVDSVSWGSNQALAIYIDNCTSLEWSDSLTTIDYSHDPLKATELHIWYTAEYDEVGSGGVICGGSADVGGHWNHTSQDGFEFGGLATVGGTITEFVGGGVKAGGTSTYGVQWWLETEGGFRFNGSAGGDAWFVSTGGALAGGSATVQLNWFKEMTDGFVISNPTYDNGFSYRLKFRVPAGEVAANIDKFYLWLSAELDPDETDGTSYLVTDDSTNELASELVRYNSTTGRVTLVVKTPLQAETNNDYWLYYKEA